MNDKPDVSLLLSMLAGSNSSSKPEEMLASLLHASHSPEENSATSSADNTSSSGNESNYSTEAASSLPDMETMMRLMQVLQTSKQDSPAKELLKSLKPFLKDKRREKVDQYIQLLGMAKALEILKETGETPK